LLKKYIFALAICEQLDFLFQNTQSTFTMKAIQKLLYALILAFVIQVKAFAMPPEVGLASFYADKFHGQKTASGEIYDKNALTAAHLTLPFGTLVKVKHLKTGKEVTVRINDRGPFTKGRIIDLSGAAAGQLGMLQEGQTKVELTIVTAPAPDPAKDKTDSNAVAKTDAEKKAAEEAKKIADAKIAEEAKKLADAKIAEEAKKLADKKAIDDKKLADKKAADDTKKAADDKKLADKKAADDKKLADKKATDDAKKAADDKKVLDDKKKNSSGNPDPAKTTKMANLEKGKAEGKEKANNNKANTSNARPNGKETTSIKQGGLYKIQASELEKKGFGVQIGGFSEYETVLSEMEKLEAQGNKAILVFVDELNGKNFYKIILGPYVNKEYADTECKKFEQKSKNKDAFVVNLETLVLKSAPVEKPADKKPAPAKGKK